MLGTSLYPTVAPISSLLGWILAVVVAVVVASLAIGIVLVQSSRRPAARGHGPDRELKQAA
jgi:hypothetical protein